MRLMKNSGIEWIGDIPSDWSKNKTIRLFSVIGSGTTPKSDDENNFSGDINWIQSGDINGGFLSFCKNQISDEVLSKYSALKVYKSPFIVIAMYGASIGNLSISNIDACVNQACCVLSETENDFNYLFYAIKTAKDYLIRKAVGGGQPNISQDTIKQLWLPQPSLEQQKKIADFLDKKCAEIDTVIEKTKATIEEYKKLKQSVITQAVTKGIRPNRPMKDSGIEWIGEIPAEWNMVKITRLLDYNVSYPIGDGDHGLISPSDYLDVGVPYLRVQNLGFGTPINDNGLVYISEETNEKIKGSILRPNDVLFAKTGATIGKTGIIPSNMPIANTTSHIGKITVSPDYNPMWILYTLSSNVGYRQFWEIAIQKTTRPELSIAEIKSIRLPMPKSRLEQEFIVNYLDKKCSEIDELIAKKTSLLSELESYKKSLIYEYVTGKKEVTQ